MKKAVFSRFKMLRTVALILRILAWVSLLGGAVSAIVIGFDPTKLSQLGFVLIYQYVWLTVLSIMIMSVVYAIIFFALSELTYVFLSMEENTRKLRELLDKK